ncbi:hypothetical protein AVEN_217069-1 [Araneus ventricosus]|uniref:Uncharacterized protein n=1 Tax=Araneus ventricosus TaxID=182803 RepID=A0A4Y2VVA9_ARAVE|nr:hypothetical protein AVEN_217069-1 [Araneus ventricosus]
MLVTVELKLHEKLADRNRTGRPEMIASKPEGQIQRLSCKQIMFIPQIKDEILLTCVSRTIRKALHINPNAAYKKLKGKTPLSERRIDSLINFAPELLPPLGILLSFSEEIFFLFK